MPDYKKKNIKKHRRSVKNVISEDISMKESEPRRSKTKEKAVPSPQKRKINVIRGNKIKIRNRRFASALGVIILILTIFIVSLFTPTGIIESAVNISASIKFGSDYPVKLSGGSLSSAVSQGNHLFLISTANFECYNTNGKNIFSYQHGLESPILCVSDSRTLLYNQSGKEYSIYNLSKKLTSNTTENEILCATISRNGTYALATNSDSYTSQVAVFNKNNEKIYEWFCADYIINDVVLSSNGKKLAVSGVSAVGGSFVSKVFILEYNSATPKSEFTYNELILGLNQSGSKGFSCITQNSVDFFTWRKSKTSTISGENNVSLIRNYGSNTLIVFERPGNKNENVITVFDSTGKEKNTFTFNNTVDYIEYKGAYIYILSENNVYLYSLSGKFEGKTSCEFGTKYISAISHKEVASVIDSGIKKITF